MILWRLMVLIAFLLLYFWVGAVAVWAFQHPVQVGVGLLLYTLWRSRHVLERKRGRHVVGRTAHPGP